MPELEGALDGSGLRIAVVVSRWNDPITRRLLDGACEALAECGVADEAVSVIWVPGAYEIPLASQSAARTGRFDAIIAIGCVIRGETDHYVHVATQCAEGLTRVALDEGLPVVFGVLTTDTVEDALARAGDRLENKGFEAAQTGIEQVRLLEAIRASE